MRIPVVTRSHDHEFLKNNSPPYKIMLWEIKENKKKGMGKHTGNLKQIAIIMAWGFIIMGWS